MRQPVEVRFWSKVAIGEPDDCWPWLRSRKAEGYGQFKAASSESPRRASRLAWQFTYGNPGDLWVLHSCDNPPCCNPAHLFLGTAADNNADCNRKGRRPPSGAHIRQIARRLTDEQIQEVRRRGRGGESARSIARSLGVAHTTISRLINGSHWAGSLEPGPA